MPFLTNDPLPQCLQTSSDIALSPPIGNRRGCGRYLLEVKCLGLRYGQLRRELELFLTRFEVSHVEPDTALDELTRYVGRLGELRDQSPALPTRFYERARARAVGQTDYTMDVGERKR